MLFKQAKSDPYRKEFGGKNILITGGAGSIGRVLVKELLRFGPAVIRILDEDETELFELQHEHLERQNLRFLVGDVRDKERLVRAMQGIDVVFHLAALKHVMSSEYNPFEAVKTNILGVQNIIDAAIENDVGKVIFTSSDKAANPSNTMGSTKLLGEKLVTAANYYSGNRTIFASVRFGNVMGSRGSVIPLFKKQIAEKGHVTVTDPTMTRFIMSMKRAVELIIMSTVRMCGGEIFIFKMPVVRIGDLIDVLEEELSSGRKIKRIVIGMRPGETSYEELMTDDEAKQAIEEKDMFILIPHHRQMDLSKRFRERYLRRKLGVSSKYISEGHETLPKEKIRQALIESGTL